MKSQPLASIVIPALANTLDWIRTAKYVTISAATPAWQVRMLNEFVRGVH